MWTLNFGCMDVGFCSSGCWILVLWTLDFGCWLHGRAAIESVA